MVGGIQTAGTVLGTLVVGAERLITRQAVDNSTTNQTHISKTFIEDPLPPPT